MMAWSRKIWNFVSNFGVFFEKTTHCGKIFKILVPKVHMATPNVADGKLAEIMHYLLDKKKFGSPSDCRYCAFHAQSLSGPAPNIWLTMCQISSESVHFLRRYNKKLRYCWGITQCAILVNSCYVSWGMGARKVSNSRSDLQGHSRALAMVTYDRPHVISY